MSYISEIFDRLDMQNLRSLLLNGVDCCEISAKTYEQRIEEAESEAVKFIKENFSNDSEKLINEFFNLKNTVDNVYMEIGIQCGIILAVKAFNTT